MRVYKRLDDALKAKLVPLGFKNVEPYNEGYNHTEGDFAKRYPLCYYELQDPVQWESLARNVQEAPVQLVMHIVDNYLADDKAGIFAWAQVVYKALQGEALKDEQDEQLTTRMMRVSSEMPKRYEQLKVMRCTFITQLIDRSVGV